MKVKQEARGVKGQFEAVRGGGAGKGDKKWEK